MRASLPRISGRTKAMLLFAVLVPPAVLLMPLPRAGRVVGIVLDLGHLAMGAVICFVLWSVFRAVSKRSRWVCGAWAWLATMALLGLAEVAQSLVDRMPSIGDMVANGLGATIAFAFVSHKWRRWWKPALLALLPMAIGLAPAGFHLWDAWQQRKAFPLLADFETHLETTRWRTSGTGDFKRTTEYHLRGAYALEATLQPDDWPNLQFAYPVPDWRGYEFLAFDIHVDKPHELLLNVIDRSYDGHYTDRFTTTFHLVPGWNPIRVSIEEIRLAPKDRTMDLSKIQSLQWFADHPKAPITFRIDHVRLEK